jgi:hypothetical protein
MTALELLSFCRPNGARLGCLTVYPALKCWAIFDVIGDTLRLFDAGKVCAIVWPVGVRRKDLGFDRVPIVGGGDGSLKF